MYICKQSALKIWQEQNGTLEKSQNRATNIMQAKFCGAGFVPLEVVRMTRPGLPDGKFWNQKSKFGLIWEGFGVINVDIFNGHLDYFKAIWYVHLMGIW
jgi:hypothetical protein